jgi:hypothetical protein
MPTIPPSHSRCKSVEVRMSARHERFLRAQQQIVVETKYDFSSQL